MAWPRPGYRCARKPAATLAAARISKTRVTTVCLAIRAERRERAAGRPARDAALSYHGVRAVIIAARDIERVPRQFAPAFISALTPHQPSHNL
jgi:hypothetical protein